MAENRRDGQQTAVNTEKITTDGQMSTAPNEINDGELSTDAEKKNNGKRSAAANKSSVPEKLNDGEKSIAADKLREGEKSTAADELMAEADRMALVEAGHKKLCSDATLITSKDGFFKTFDKQVAETVSDEQFEAFSQLSDDQERVFFVWNLPTVHSTLKIKTFYREKNLKNAERCKNEGNKYFQQKAYKTAINHYNQTVALAPQGEILAVGFANRSAALFHLQLYKPCLRDIKTAMENNYPSHLHYKIFDRKNLCLMKLGHVNEARRTLEELQKSLEFAKMDDNKRASWESDIKQRISEVSGRTDFVPIMKPADINTVEPPTISTFNQRFHNASASVDVCHSEDCGRFAVAAADLQPGELLVVEKPYASALLPAKMGSHCLHCLKRMFVAYPCSLCSGVAFCSTECSQLAVNHVWECRIQNLLNASGMSILCHLALKMVTKNSLHFFKDIRSALGSSSKDRSRPPCTQDGVYDASSYLAVHQLVTLSELRPHTDMFHRSLMAVFLLKCLRVVGYFREPSQADYISNDEDASRPLTSDEIFIGSLLLRHLQLLQFNAHEVGEYMMMSPGQFKQSRSVNIGVAVYPTVSFFNHSCEGGVARYFIGDTVVIRSVRPLSAGEVIYENYGPVYSHKSLQDRQMTLKSRYWFDCKCRACVENWPDYDQYDINKVLIRCQKCGSPIENDASGKNATGICPSCGEKNNIIDLFRRLANAQELYQSGMLMMHEGQVDKALRAFYRFINQSYDLVCLPNRDISLCQEAVRMCLSSFGSMHTVRSKPAL